MACLGTRQTISDLAYKISLIFFQHYRGGCWEAIVNMAFPELRQHVVSSNVPRRTVRYLKTWYLVLAHLRV